MKVKNTVAIEKMLNEILLQADKDNKSESIKQIGKLKKECHDKGIKIPIGFSISLCYKKIDNKSLINRKIRSDRFSKRNMALNKNWQKYKEFILSEYSKHPDISIHKLAELTNEHALQNNYETVKITTLSRHIKELLRIGFNSNHKISHSKPENILKIFITNPENYFFASKSKEEIGKIIEFANLESTFEKKAESFLSLIINKRGNG